jgi:hypothetical protein
MEQDAFPGQRPLRPDDEEPGPKREVAKAEGGAIS